MFFSTAAKTLFYFTVYVVFSVSNFLRKSFPVHAVLSVNVFLEEFILELSESSANNNHVVVANIEQKENNQIQSYEKTNKEQELFNIREFKCILSTDFTDFDSVITLGDNENIFRFCV